MALAVALCSKSVSNASEAELILFAEAYLEALIHHGWPSIQVLGSPFFIPVRKCLLRGIHLREGGWETCDISLTVGLLELIIESCALLMIIYRWNDERGVLE